MRICSKILVFIFAVAAIFISGSCSDRLDGIEDPTLAVDTDEKTMRLTFESSPMVKTDNTRSDSHENMDEGDEGNPYVKDVWLVEYGSDGLMVGTPMYMETPEGLSSLDVPLIVPTDDKAEYTLVAIANTHAPEMKTEIMQLTTLESMKNFTLDFCGDQESYRRSEENNDMLMNGCMKLSNSSDMNEEGRHTGHLNLTLARNIAKISVSVKTKASSGVNIKSVQVMSVPDVMRYAESLNTDIPGKERGYLNLPSQISMPSSDTNGNEGRELTFYVPRNMRGSNQSKFEESKNIGAPVNATYVEIKAEDTINHKYLRYKFYIGANMTNDFNVEPNHCYSLDIDIENAYSHNDSRVEVSDYLVAEEANSYIVNYVANGTPSVQPLLTVPISRINKFWGNVNLKHPDNTRILGSSTRWTADVIWQDSAEDLFYFCDTSGNKIEGAPHFFNGVGLQPFSIRPTGRGTGNVLIGVRLPDSDPDVDGYLWSWHLWITDYNPDLCKEKITLEKDIFEVEGGTVHRYNTDYWRANNSTDLGICIMDRNFGAHRSKLEDPYKGELGPYRGLYYYFGRKDPFPCIGIPLYRYKQQADTTGHIVGDALIKDENGKTFIRGELVQSYIENTVKHPNIHYTCGLANSWTEESFTTDNVYAWNDGSLSGLKHLFDPFPLGWRLPHEDEIFDPSCFENEFRTYVSNDKTGETQRILGFFYRLRKGTFSEAGDPENEEVFFPISGTERMYLDGKLTLYWTGYKEEKDGCYILSRPNGTHWKIFSNPCGNVSTNNTLRRLASPTRLVRDPKTIM